MPPSPLRKLLPCLLLFLAALGRHPVAADPAPQHGVVRGNVSGAGAQAFTVKAQSQSFRMRLPSPTEGTCRVVEALKVAPASIPAGTFVTVRAGSDGSLISLVWLLSRPKAPGKDVLIGTVAGIANGIARIKGTDGQVTSLKVTADSEFLRDTPSAIAGIANGRKVVVSYDFWPPGKYVARLVRLLPDKK